MQRIEQTAGKCSVHRAGMKRRRRITEVTQRLRVQKLPLLGANRNLLIRCQWQAGAAKVNLSASRAKTAVGAALRFRAANVTIV